MATAVDDAEEEVIDLREVVIEPNDDCDVDAGLLLELSFSARRAIRGAHWSVSVVFDSVCKRQIVDLGRTADADYDGPSSFRFEVDRINVDGIDPSVLANCGLLVAALVSGAGDELCRVNMVVQISADSAGRLTRTVYSPLG